MSYKYEDERQWLFTDEGQRDFLKVRDEANRLANQAGAFTVGHAMDAISGSSWQMLACVDRLVELGEFRYVYTDGAKQHHVLVRAS